MDEFEFMLEDRIAKIQAINKQYDLENNAYISFSGGKDSTILHYLIDLALPNNNIPRVFINTGIEYLDIVRFVKEMQQKDDRIIIINSGINIKQMLEKYGYPFKSKQHSHNLAIYQNENYIDCDNNEFIIKQSEKKKKLIQIPYLESYYEEYTDYHIPLTLVRYLGVEKTNTLIRCPNKLRYQFTKYFNIKVSDECCNRLKKIPIKNWSKNNNKFICLTGMRKEEGGQRKSINCVITDKENNLVKFHPLLVVSDKWENEFIEKYNIKLCKLYYPPYNFKRTGCKGCPFSLNLQEQLEIMDKHLPNEKKQCEIIWKPVYEEYRRIGYRLNKKQEYEQMTIYDFINFQER